MKLLICLITYNRLEYTKRTLESLLETITVPFQLVIVDNNSTDGTKKWLTKEVETGRSQGGVGDIIILNPVNEYPGKACNLGWQEGLGAYGEATHLMRCDNDMEFEPGWDKKAEAYFEAMPPLGQLGLDHSALDTFNGDPRYITTSTRWSKFDTLKQVNAWPGNIGGPCIIRREVYDKGARYDETPWQDLRSDPSKMITPQEDVKFSLSMHNYGYIYGHPTEKLATTFANEHNRSDYPEYYKKTMAERGYL